MDILVQTAFLLGVFAFGLSVSVISRNPRNKLYVSYGALGGVLSVWALSFSLARLLGTRPYYRIHLLAHIWITPVGLAFMRVLLRERLGVFRRFFELSIILSSALTGALVLGYHRVSGFKQTIFLSPVILGVAICVALLWPSVGLARVTDLEVSRKRFILFGALGVLCTAQMDHLTDWPMMVSVTGNILLAVYLFLVYQAISRQRLLNFSALLTRGSVISLIALVLTGLYSFLFTWIERDFGLFFLYSFIISFLLLLLLEPIRAGVAFVSGRLLSKKYARLDNVLQEARQKLLTTVEPESLTQLVLQVTEQVLRPTKTAVYLLKPDGTKYQRVRMSGDRAPNRPREILPDHPLIGFSTELAIKGELPILLDHLIENEIDRTSSQKRREEDQALLDAMRSLDGNVWIPLMDSDHRVLAFVVASVSAPPESWGGSWSLLHLLYPYYDQAGRILKSMEVFTRSRQKERLAVLGQMAAGLAHEIRNPLGAIKGAAQLLDPTQDRPDSKFLTVIVEEVDRLNHVVSQFLDFSKPQAKEFSEVEIGSLVEKTLEILRSTTPIEIRLHKDIDTARILSAPGQIQQIVVNLVQNALQILSSSLPEGRTPLITVELARESRLGGRREIVLSVEDNGPGIKKDMIDQVFIPFVSRRPGGTGLGLSICQKLVEDHQGRIEVESEEGRYARFTVWFPEVR